FYLAVNGDRRDKHVAFDVALQNLSGVSHPRWKRRRIIDNYVPLATFQRVEFAIAIANELFDFVRQFAGVRFAAVERRDLMSAAQRVLHLIWTGESRAAENQNAQRFHGFLRE